MVPHMLTFSDIQTTDLIYFDPDCKETCFRFCQQRDIDCLPSLSNPATFFQKTEEGFQENEIPVERIVDHHDPIFDPLLLEQFQASPLLFVCTNRMISGVVHFSDYNQAVVHTYLFSLISSYERSLRKLLCLNGLNNADMLDFYKRNRSRKAPAQNEKRPPFEQYYLLDLIQLASEGGVITVSEEPNKLRNSVMHAHDLVNLNDANRGDFVYTMASFEEFFQQVIVLLRDFKKVNNRIALFSLGEV